MSVYKVDICGVTTSKLPVLKDEEKEELFEKIKKGDKAAREKYIRGNLRLVLSVIRRFSNHNENMDDLFQIGCIGLMKSIDNFDISLDIQLSTYAVPMIIGEIRRYLRDNNNVKISRQIKDLAYKILKYKEKYLIEHNKEPSSFEIAKYLNEDVYKIDEAIKSLNCVVALQDTWTNDDTDELTYLDHISEDFNIEEKIINKNTLKQGISMLDDIQKNIIIKRLRKMVLALPILYWLGNLKLD